MAPETVANPYLGPRPFTRADAALFFGRERDARRLRALVDGEEIAVFYAESGAGKTSLVGARLVPELEAEGCEVLVAVGFGGAEGGRGGGTAGNAYVADLLAALAPDAVVAGETLAAFLARREAPPAGRRLLVVDQLEELWTAHPERRDERDGFFRELQEAVAADPRLSVLLVMREDRIAALDAHVHLLRDRLQGRLRMERLRREDAVAAIREPAARAGRPFAQGVAEELARLLSLERLPAAGGWRAGEGVGAVELQVVCRHLWERVAAEDAAAPEITARHLATWGDVDQALERFYDRAVAATAADREVPEEELRRWIESTLVTPQNLRTQVPFDPGSASVEGLATAAARELVDVHHLLRSVEARGGLWLELAHDRFVDGVRRSNARWLARGSDLAAAARAVARGDPSHFRLFRGRRLRRELARAEASPHLFSAAERSFLAEARRRERRRIAGRAAAATAFALVLVAGFLTLELRRVANVQRLFVARQELAAAPAEGLRQALAAADAFPAPPAFELSDVLRQGLYALRSPRRWARPGARVVGSLAWSGDGRLLASADVDGRVQLWNATGEVAARFEDAPLGGVAWLATNRDGSLVAVFDRRGSWLWETASGRRGRLEGAPTRVEAAAFSPDDALLAAVAADAGLHVWPTGDHPTGSAPAPPPLAGSFVSLAWLADDRLVLGDADGRLDLVEVGAEGPRLVESRVAHAGAVHALALGREVLATSGADDLVWLWTTESWEASGPLRHDAKVVDLAFAADGHTLLTLDVADTVHVWSLDVRREVDRFPAVPRPGDDEPAPPVPGGLGPGAALLARWDGDAQGIEVRGLVTAVVPTLAGHTKAVSALAFDAAGERLASTGEDGVRLWDVATGRPLEPSEKSLAPRADADAVGPGLRAMVEEDGSISLRELASNRLLHADLVQPGERLHVEALAISPDGRLVAAADRRRILVWETANGGLAAVVPASWRGVRALAFGPGDLLASAGEDGLVHLDPLALPDLVRLARTRLEPGEAP